MVISYFIERGFHGNDDKSRSQKWLAILFFMLKQIFCKRFSLQLGVFEVDGIFELGAFKVERFIKFCVFEDGIALEDSVSEAHTFWEFCVLKIGQVAKFHIRKIDFSRELCVFEVCIMNKLGTGKAYPSRKFRVFKERFFVIGGFCEIRSLMKFGVFERGFSLEFASLEDDIGMKNSVVRFVFFVIMIIGNDIAFESAVNQA
jgi:hypothetical protein